MTHYAGLDVSVKETAICVIDAGGAVVWQGKVPTQIEAIAEALLSCPWDVTASGTSPQAARNVGSSGGDWTVRP